jgi:hypothetical protein
MEKREKGMTNINLGELFNEDQSPGDLIFDIFSARGFLIEKRNGKLYLSEDSVLAPVEFEGMFKTDFSDVTFLQTLLKETGYGSIDKKGRIIPGRYDPEKLKLIFDFKSIPFDTEYSANLQGWDSFKQMPFMKIPVAVLEPFVARFIKALSAIGIATDASCDGHGEGGVHIRFVGPYQLHWFFFLHGLITREISLKNKSIFGVYYFDIVPELPGKKCSIEFYREVLFLANLLYEKRFFFRSLKNKLLSNIKEENPELKKVIIQMDVVAWHLRHKKRLTGE